VPGAGSNRKHPAIATARNGLTLLVWTEGTGWNKEGSLAWPLFDEAGRPLGARGGSSGLPAGDFAATVSVEDRFFVIS